MQEQTVWKEILWIYLPGPGIRWECCNRMMDREWVLKRAVSSLPLAPDDGASKSHTSLSGIVRRTSGMQAMGE